LLFNQDLKSGDAMNHVRGVLMLVASGVAVWRGWKIHTGSHAWMAYGLAALALGLAVWHLTRPSDVRRI
jgi:thiol:disulfide interchange protein